MTDYSLPDGEYLRRLLRARAFMIRAGSEAKARADEALKAADLATAELSRLDRQIASLNRGGAA